MPRWFCRVAEALDGTELCEGPRHDECGVHYSAGEFRWDGNGDLHLDGVPAPVHIPGLAQLPPRNPSAAIVWEDTEGWNAEFLETTP